jgi:hypothetical protein
LETPEAVDPLVRFASHDLPKADSSPVDATSARGEEIILRLTAIKGIAKMSTRNDRALEAIQGFFQHENVAIRHQALNDFAEAIRIVDDERRQKRLIALFPRDYAFELRPYRPATPGVEGGNPNQVPTGTGNGAAPTK